LVGADDLEGVEKLLTDLIFLEEKMRLLGVEALLQDYNLAVTAFARARKANQRSPDRILSFLSMLRTYQAELREEPQLLVQYAYHCPRGSPAQVCLSLAHVHIW